MIEPREKPLLVPENFEIVWYLHDQIRQDLPVHLALQMPVQPLQVAWYVHCPTNSPRDAACVAGSRSLTESGRSRSRRPTSLTAQDTAAEAVVSVAKRHRQSGRGLRAGRVRGPHRFRQWVFTVSKST